jgi:hypothetical protein
MTMKFMMNLPMKKLKNLKTTSIRTIISSHQTSIARTPVYITFGKNN